MEIEDLLAASSATDAFKVAVRAYREHRDAPAIQVVRHSPRVKVQRLLSQLLSAEPQLAIESVVVEATSGCSDFRGSIRVETRSESKVFNFVWDCQWRAREEGWTDYFGFPDQIRAAREFGWRCFAAWEEAGTGVPAGLLPALTDDLGTTSGQLA
jgi:hypothetical protein